MLSIDPWNILWTVVNLLVLYLVFKKFLFKPVMKVINAREDMIKQQFDDAKKSQEEADAFERISKAGYKIKFALLPDVSIGTWDDFKGKFGY